MFYSCYSSHHIFLEVFQWFNRFSLFLVWRCRWLLFIIRTSSYFYLVVCVCVWCVIHDQDLELFWLYVCGIIPFVLSWLLGRRKWWLAVWFFHCLSVLECKSITVWNQRSVRWCKIVVVLVNSGLFTVSSVGKFREFLSDYTCLWWTYDDLRN